MPPEDTAFWSSQAGNKNWQERVSRGAFWQLSFPEGFPPMSEIEVVQQRSAGTACAWRRDRAWMFFTNSKGQ